MDVNIPYGRQNITDDDLKAVCDALKSPLITQGPRVIEFEKKFAEYVGAKYALAMNNATSGLHLAAIALDVKPGDKVIVTPITFASSANCIRFCGGDVEFCDIDPETFLMDSNKLQAMINSHPKDTYKGVVVVDFAGYPQNLEEISKICKENNMWLIEDACHAPGGWFVDSHGQKQRCGNGQYADISVFSFHPVKHIACGEGGMCTTNNKELFKKMELYRTHGITKDHSRLEKYDGLWYYEMQELGFNYRLTDFQAALGISQLSRNEQGLKRRHEIAKRYDEAFKKIKDIKSPYRADGIFHAFHLYVIRTPRRKELYDYLQANGVHVQVHYVPLNTMPYYRKHGAKTGDCPVAESYYEQALSLPMYPTLTEEEQQYVIDKCIEFVGK